MGSWIVAFLGGCDVSGCVPWRWYGSLECRLHIGNSAGPSSWDNENTRHVNLRYERARQRVRFVPRTAI